MRDLVFTLDLLCTGSLAGVFDGATSHPIDLDAPAVSVDISAVKAAGDKLLTAAMLCTWSYGFGCVDAASALADLGAAPARSYLAVMDELWRALRGAPGLVEHADSLTRLNRARGMAHIMITHSLADLDALATEEDRARARGFMDRSAITVLAGLPPRELARVAEITPLTGPERALVASWSAPESYQPGARHPGRGKYLIKTGERLGIPVQLTLTGPEHYLYDTDQAIRASQGPATRSGPSHEPGSGATPIAGAGRNRRRVGRAGHVLGTGRARRADLGRRPDRRRVHRRHRGTVRAGLRHRPGPRAEPPARGRAPRRPRWPWPVWCFSAWPPRSP